MLEETISEIRYWHRQRGFAMEQRKRTDLSLGAFLRMALGWSKALPEAERKRIAAQAQGLIDVGEAEAKAIAKGKPVPECDEPAYEEWRDLILASMQARAPFDVIEARATKEMERLAKTLPAWEWAKDVKGFGARSLAVIVGEAGDVGSYPAKGHLWKRMGLAVIDGVRQGGLRKSASADEWIVHGYSRKRRSQMFVIGDVMVKVGDTYRQVYLYRKAYERARAEAAGLTVVPAAKIPKARAAEFMSDGHIHRRAQRYMEKRLLRDLWQAWRGHEPEAERPFSHSPAPEHREAA
jgi:hypothetical protein